MTEAPYKTSHACPSNTVRLHFLAHACTCTDGSLVSRVNRETGGAVLEKVDSWLRGGCVSRSESTTVGTHLTHQRRSRNQCLVIPSPSSRQNMTLETTTTKGEETACRRGIANTPNKETLLHIEMGAEPIRTTAAETTQSKCKARKQDHGRGHLLH